MKYTNKHHLSQEIYNVIVERQNKYTPGDVDYSVTEILNPPRIVLLTKWHYDELEMDVTEVLDAWQGHLLHDALEQDETSNRLHLRWDGLPTLSGAYDYYSGGLLKDYKRTSVWSYIYGSVQEKWEQQLNIYAMLLRQSGQEVDTIGIEVFLKDWNKNEALRNRDYPQCPQFFMRMNLWEDWKVKQFVVDRLADLEFCRKTCSDSTLPECTEKDMWAKPTTYAVMFKENKKADRVFASEDAAYEYINDAPHPRCNHLSVVERPGERVRCKKYCNVANYCSQWRDFCRNQENQV